MSENKADPLREAMESAEASFEYYDARVEVYGREVRIVFVADIPTQANSLAGAILQQMKTGALNIILMGKPTSIVAIPQPAAPLGGREALARLIRKALVENWCDAYDGRKWDEDVLLTGCRKVGGGMGYHKPEEAAQRLSLDAADAILAAIPQERAADPQRLREVLGAFYNTVDVMKSVRNGNSKLMNIWSDDMKAVEDVMLFLEHLRDATPPVVAGTDRAAIIEECAKVIEQYQERISETSNGSKRFVSPRMHGNLIGLAYADAIRALAGKETGR